MHEGKVLRLSHEGFFLSRAQKESIFGNFSWMLSFEIISNANLFDFFINNLLNQF
jgi:hypothetical protein